MAKSMLCRYIFTFYIQNSIRNECLHPIRASVLSYSVLWGKDRNGEVQRFSFLNETKALVNDPA